MMALRRLGLALLLLPGAVRAEERPVDLELVLAVDVSWSMDEEEQRLQREGYVEALRSNEVLQGVRSGVYGRVGLVYVEWAGVADQQVVVPWGIVEDRASLDGYAARLEAVPLRRSAFTAIGNSLAFAAGLFAGNGMEGARRVIDVSGDGPNNMGPPVVPARDAVVAKGIVVNGLPLMLRPGSPGIGLMPDLDLYYEDCVIGGPGAFSLPVRHRAEIKDAIRQKLVIEIAGDLPRVVPVALAGEAPRVDCMVGDKARPRWMNEP